MTALLIAFYDEDLTGTIYDLYRAYKYARDVGLKITVLTNIDKIKPSYHHIQDDIDDGVYTFLADVTYITTLKDMMTALKKITPKLNLFLYISCHGTREGIVMPNKDIFSYKDMRGYLDLFPSAFVVLDCCYANSLELAYKFNRERCRLLDKYELTTNDIYLFTASREDEKAKMEASGSYFTKYFFKTLHECYQRKRKRFIASILNYLNLQAIEHGKERYAAYCSLPRNKLPYWIVDFYDIKQRGIFYLLKKHELGD